MAKTTNSRPWITDGAPDMRDADEFYQVEICLSKSRTPATLTAYAYFGNIGKGTPWRRTHRWRSRATPGSSHISPGDAERIDDLIDYYNSIDGGSPSEPMEPDSPTEPVEVDMFTLTTKALADLGYSDDDQLNEATAAACPGEDRTEPVVRTYRSITRTWDSHASLWVFDAIADDGTAWRRLEDERWVPHPSLPQPDQCED